MKMKNSIKKLINFLRSIFKKKTKPKVIGKPSSKIRKKELSKLEKMQESRYNWLCKAGLTPRDTKKAKISFTTKRYEKAKSINKATLYVKRKGVIVPTHYRSAMNKFKAELDESRVNKEENYISRFFTKKRNKFGIFTKIKPLKKELAPLAEIQ